MGLTRPEQREVYRAYLLDVFTDRSCFGLRKHAL